jgi:hypothetical protein
LEEAGSVAKLSPKKLTRHFWSEESGLTSMLVLLCISNFVVMPFLSDKEILSLFMRITWFFLLVTGIATLSKDRRQMIMFAVVPFLLFIFSALQYLITSEVLVIAEFIMELSVFGLLIGMVLVKVFEFGPVTIHRVVGAIVVYMLIGNFWSQIYQFLYIQIPGSLQMPSAITESGVTTDVFLYFSYTTLTTTGYGDILPSHPATRTVVMTEQLIGVLYLAIFIGRLVSLITGTRDTKQE